VSSQGAGQPEALLLLGHRCLCLGSPNPSPFLCDYITLVKSASLLARQVLHYSNHTLSPNFFFSYKGVCLLFLLSCGATVSQGYYPMRESSSHGTLCLNSCRVSFTHKTASCILVEKASPIGPVTAPPWHLELQPGPIWWFQGQICCFVPFPPPCVTTETLLREVSL
jgi:hypothetical protein